LDGWLEVGLEPVGVGQGEGSEGGFPALDGGAFYQAWGCLALVAWLATLLGSFAGSLVLDVADRQPEQLDDRVVGREVAPVLDDLSELEV